MWFVGLFEHRVYNVDNYEWRGLKTGACAQITLRTLLLEYCDVLNVRFEAETVGESEVFK
jgi:hypothetical protein